MFCRCTSIPARVDEPSALSTPPSAPLRHGGGRPEEDLLLALLLRRVALAELLPELLLQPLHLRLPRLQLVALRRDLVTQAEHVLRRLGRVLGLLDLLAGGGRASSCASNAEFTRFQLFVRLPLLRLKLLLACCPILCGILGRRLRLDAYAPVRVER